MAETRLIQGNEACALGAIAAGCRFFGGYPITPSSGIAEQMVRMLPEVDGVFIQMEDEIASLAAVIGASLGGSKAMTATSGPGFSLMQEHIGFATMAEVPCVIVNVMRGGPSTGLPTSPSQGDVMQARWGTHGDHPAVVVAPASVGEVHELTVRAFNLAERFRTPVIVTYDEVVGHTRESVMLPERVQVVDRERPTVPPEDYRPKRAAPDGVPAMAGFGDGYRFHVTGLAHDERGFPTQDNAVAGALLTRLHRKIEDHLEEVIDVEEYMLDDADVVLFAYGIVGRSAREAVRRARDTGLRAGLFRPRTLWPFPGERLAQVTARANKVIVAEMNLGQMIAEVQRAVVGPVEVVGHLRADGKPITPSELLDELLAQGEDRS